MYGVTRQYVSWVVDQYPGVTRTPRESVREHYPFIHDGSFHGCIISRLLRHHLEYIATGGKGMSYEKLQRLRTFYERIQNENVVVEFDPDLPPYPGNKFGGFAYRPRLESDGALIIRINEHTKEITPVDLERFWRVPKRLPSPSTMAE